MKAWYNEINPFAAQHLRNLIAAGHIAPGVVDERSIEDFRPDELAGYTQCHFFAGVGVWSYALRLAGWPDDKPVWTGSCPCQPFSTAGKGAGFNDERHLWPSFQWLIQKRRPPVIFGEQVASKDVEPWIDLVHADLEAMGYTFGCIPFPSAGVGAPHIRDRAFWVGYAGGKGLEGFSGHGHNGYQPGRVGAHSAGPAAPASGALRVGNADRESARRNSGTAHCAKAGDGPSSRNSDGSGNAGSSFSERVAHMHSNGRNQARECITTSGDERIIRDLRTVKGQPTTGPVNGFWGTADWLLCRDGKWRPVEPGTFPLAHGVTNRVGRLRAYGNAINAEAAKAFIECFMEYAQ